MREAGRYAAYAGRVTSLEIVSRGGHPDFLDLPWETSLATWTTPRLVDLARGVSRHTVRFVDYDGVVYAIKETEEPVATAEYDLLRALADRRLPVVEAVAVIHGRNLEPGGGALITRHLSFSMPFRYLFQSVTVENLASQLLDALALLLVRLHLDGFFWGDCSLSNALFRRDAGALSAYLVDAETGTLGEQRCSDGQRRHDIDLAAENVGGELLDLQAAGRLHERCFDPLEIGDELRSRYEGLWDEIVREEIVPLDDRHKLAARIRRLNELGFDVQELRTRRTDNTREVRIVPHVVELGHHRRRLEQLTGLVVDEGQARRLLNDLDGHRAELEYRHGASVPDALAGYDWLSTVYRRTLDSIPDDLLARLPEAEVFHQILEHRWYRSEEAGYDVGMDAAADDYVSHILAGLPEELAILPDAEDGETGDTGDVLDGRPEDEPDDESEAAAATGALTAL